MGLLDAPVVLPRSLVPGVMSHVTTANVNDNLSNGTTDLASNTRVRSVVIENCFDPRFAFANWYSSGGVDTDGPNDITIRAALESPAGLYVPLRFNAARDVIIGPGGTVWSDPVGVDLRFGDVWFIRTFVTVTTTGYKWSRNVVLLSAQGEGVDATNTDKTTSGTITASGGSGVGPVAVRAFPGKAKIPVVGVVGDSIVSGTGDASSTDRGWVRLAVNNTRALQMVGFPSDTSGNWTDVTSQNIPSRTSRRRPLLEGCTHIVTALGRNTLSATAVDDANGIAVLAIAHWKWLKRRGFTGIWQTTITPQTTSTDSWATVVNQTVASAPIEANRVIFNTWLRDGAPIVAGAYVVAGTSPAIRAGQSGHPLTGVLDVTAQVESATNSGKWQAAYTADGTHPTTTGHTAMATALTPSIFGPAASA